MLLLGYAIAFALHLQGADLKSLDMVLGEGAAAEAGDVVAVEYTGNLLDGKVFDSSVGKAPYAFNLGADEVVKGWDQGLAGMKEGGRRILSVPSSLGFGDHELDEIPANSTLIFDIKLLRVDKKGAVPQIKIEELAPGTGPEAKDGDTVQVQYVGTFLNGVKFDASARRAPLKFKLGVDQMIAGFAQGVRGMKVGQKRKVTIPYQLAYGASGRPGMPPYATLVFELDLVKIG